MSANYLKLIVDETQVVFHAHETKLELHRIRLQMLRRKELYEFVKFLGTEVKKLQNEKTLGAITKQNLNYITLLTFVSPGTIN